jgi:putative endonuclease
MPEDAHKKHHLQSQIGDTSRPGARGGEWRPRSPSASHSNAAQGTRGEAIAAEHLRKNCGFTILARNWRNPRDKREEIDLIALKSGAVIFVEVKTRKAGNLVPGYFAVGQRKRRSVRGAVRAYLATHFPRPRTFRFDVVEVETGAGPPLVRHFENVDLFMGFDP